VSARDLAVANRRGVLLMPNSTQAVPCRWSPNVRLFAQVDGGPSTLVGSGARRLVTEDGVTYPVWDFNSVDIRPAAQGKTIEFWLDVNGVTTHATRWTYPPPPAAAATDSGTAEAPVQPTWQQKPTSSCQ